MPQIAHDSGPGKQKYSLDIEHEIQDGVQIISGLELHLGCAMRRNTTLVGFAFLKIERSGG